MGKQAKRRVPLPRWVTATQLLWAVGVAAYTLLWAVSVFLLLYRWDPAFNSDIRHGGSSDVALQLRIGVALSIVPAVLAVVCITQTALCLRTRRVKGLRMAVIWGALAAVGPAVSHVALPWEDPYTGDGSPLATLIGIVALGVFGMVMACPGGAIALWAGRYARPSAPELVESGNDPRL